MEACLELKLNGLFLTLVVVFLGVFPQIIIKKGLTFFLANAIESVFAKSNELANRIQERERDLTRMQQFSHVINSKPMAICLLHMFYTSLENTLHNEAWNRRAINFNREVRLGLTTC
ncbi:hypothetical protein ACJX0J_020214 [Zea mays]